MTNCLCLTVCGVKSKLGIRSKIGGIRPWRQWEVPGENDDAAVVKGNFDQSGIPYECDQAASGLERPRLLEQNAVVNTQNNTESFQAGKSALALMNVNTAKSMYNSIMEEHPEWDIRVFDAQEGVPAVVEYLCCQRYEHFLKSKHPDRALMALSYLRNDKECNSLFCYGIEGKHWEAVGENGLKSLPAAPIILMTATATGEFAMIRTGVPLTKGDSGSGGAERGMALLLQEAAGIRPLFSMMLK